MLESNASIGKKNKKMHLRGKGTPHAAVVFDWYLQYGRNRTSW